MSRKTDTARREVRRKTVAANLLGGLNYRAMSEALGVSVGTIAADVKIILGRWEREQVDAINQLKQLQKMRLDRALNAIWDRVLEGDDRAINSMVKIMERHDKIFGLDAPIKRELSGPDGGPIQTQQTPPDLSGLSNDELGQLAAIASRLAGGD